MHASIDLDKEQLAIDLLKEVDKFLHFLHFPTMIRILGPLEVEFAGASGSLQYSPNDFDSSLELTTALLPLLPEIIDLSLISLVDVLNEGDCSAHEAKPCTVRRIGCSFSHQNINAFILVQIISGGECLSLNLDANLLAGLTK